jgi:hypothetical protein
VKVLGLLVMIAALIAGCRQVRAELNGQSVSTNESFAVWVLLAAALGFMAWEFAAAFT